MLLGINGKMCVWVVLYQSIGIGATSGAFHDGFGKFGFHLRGLLLLLLGGRRTAFGGFQESGLPESSALWFFWFV